MFGYYPLCKQGNRIHQRATEVGRTRTVGPSISARTGTTAPAFRKSFIWAFLPTSARAATEPTILNHGMKPTTARARKQRFPDRAEQLSNNPGGLKKGTGSSQSFNAVEAEGNDLVHSDGKTAQKAVELLRKYKDMEKPFFWQWIRTATRLWWLRKNISNLTARQNGAAAKIPGDQDDIPQNSGNRRTTANYQMDLNQQKGTLRAYYASVSFVDALVGKILTALEATASRTTPSSSSPATTDTTWANTTFGRR